MQCFSDRMDYTVYLAIAAEMANPCLRCRFDTAGITASHQTTGTKKTARCQAAFCHFIVCC